MCRVLLGTFCIAASLVLLAGAGESRGELLTFEYSGAVTFGGGTVFGVPIDAAATVSGQLKAETTAPMTHDFGNGRAGYHQAIAGGLNITFDDGVTESTFVADEYLVVIGNDIDLEDYFVDGVEFLFSSALDPRLTTPLLVNGEPRKAGDYNQDGFSNALDYAKWKSDFSSTGSTADGNENGIVDAADYTVWRDGGPIGYFSVEFLTFDTEVFDSSSLADADLAANLTPANFGSFFNRLGDSAEWPDVFFDVPNFALAGAGASPTPEPSAFVLFALGAGMHASRRIRSRFRTCQLNI